MPAYDDSEMVAIPPRFVLHFISVNKHSRTVCLTTNGGGEVNSGNLSSQGCEEYDKHQVPGNNSVQGLAICCASVVKCENI